MIRFTCRRCAGRGRRPEESLDCFLCLGKGEIVIDPKKVRDQYRRPGATKTA